MNQKSILPFGSRTFIMGIINLTPDSFSGDGLLSRQNAVDAAVKQALHFVEDGADILDLGAESTRPGSSQVDAEIELERLLPSLQRILALDLKVLISIDTSKARVAQGCLDAGAHMINRHSHAQSQRCEQGSSFTITRQPIPGKRLPGPHAGYFPGAA